MPVFPALSAVLPALSAVISQLIGSLANPRMISSFFGADQLAMALSEGSPAASHHQPARSTRS
jgi:hypothetical protein